MGEAGIPNRETRPDWNRRIRLAAIPAALIVVYGPLWGHAWARWGQSKALIQNHLVRRLLCPGKARGGDGPFHRSADGSIPVIPMPTTAWRRSSPARGGMPRRKLISRKRYGSDPAISKHTTIWASSSCIAATTRRRGLSSPRPYGSNPATRTRTTRSALHMAACPEPKFRDGKRAVQFATRACELTHWQIPVVLDTLAAAQAEAGDFDAAVKWQLRAIELLRDERQKADHRSRLALYRAKRPYHQVAPRPAPPGTRP